MTVQEFHINFDILVDKTIDFESPYILPEQKDFWLNKAQDRFTKSKLYPNDPREKGFEETQRRIDDLRTLVKNPPEYTPVQDGTKYITQLPNDYLYLVRHRCKTTDSYGVKDVGGILSKQEFLNQMLKDPFWKPTTTEPLYYFVGNNIVYETLGDFTVTKTNLTYIKEPLKIQLGSQYVDTLPDQNCELPEHTHTEILDMAVSMFLENIESQRYQTNLNELNKN